jgi:hypothetical protein
LGIHLFIFTKYWTTSASQHLWSLILSTRFFPLGFVCLGVTMPPLQLLTLGLPSGTLYPCLLRQMSYPSASLVSTPGVFAGILGMWHNGSAFSRNKP